jgi:predicted MFS family arabinose efflux permease
MRHSLSHSLPARNLRFRHFLVASTVSLTGSQVFDISMPLYALNRHGSAMELSLLMVALYLPHFLMAPVTGYLSDRAHKRHSLLLADFGQIAVLLLLSLYVLSEKPSLWPVLVAVFLVKSLMLTFENISQFQLIPALVGDDSLAAGNTWFLSLHRVIQIIGPLLGGMLLHFWGVQSCIWLNILSFSATLYFTWSFRDLDAVLGTGPVPQGHRSSTEQVVHNFKESLRFIWKSPVFHPFILLMFLWNLSSLTLNSPSLTYYFTVTQQFSAAQYGFVMSGFGIIGIIGFVLSPELYGRRPFAQVFHRSALFQAVFGTLSVLPLGFPVLVGALFGVSRAGSSVLSMGSYFIRQTRVPKKQNGSVNASLRMFFMAAAPASSLLQGWLIETYSVHASLAVGTLCLWGTWWYSRQLGLELEREETRSARLPQPEEPERRRA